MRQTSVISSDSDRESVPATTGLIVCIGFHRRSSCRVVVNTQIVCVICPPHPGVYIHSRGCSSCAHKILFRYIIVIRLCNRLGSVVYEHLHLHEGSVCLIGLIWLLEDYVGRCEWRQLILHPRVVIRFSEE